MAINVPKIVEYRAESLVGDRVRRSPAEDAVTGEDHLAGSLKPKGVFVALGRRPWEPRRSLAAHSSRYGGKRSSKAPGPSRWAADPTEWSDRAAQAYACSPW